ncbi:MAG TPA: hypothetical protein VKP65_21475 [Rhodothermales bacterium]|nr:hypothetical protein [Rhodothermales bacterium]
MSRLGIFDFLFSIGTGGLRHLVYVFFVLTLAGCLPSSCRRVDSRAVAPADSLSRQLAEQLTPDTLQLVWSATGSAEAAMEYPRTVRFGPANRLYVSDAQRNSVFAFAKDGTWLEEITWDSVAVPYLAGLRGDTLVVFNPENRRLDFVLNGTAVRSLHTPPEVPRGPLHYAAATDSALYYKVVGDEFEGYLARLDEHGSIAERIPLPGPAWRHAGLLRPWGDSLLSLSGFLPSVDVLTPAGRLDSLALVGFDSPMLARRYSFLQGDTHESPLLSPAATPAGNWLFVLNLRPGWLRIDVYDRAGHLQHILTQANPGYNKQFYPIDLAVQQDTTGAFDIAVLTVEPVQELRRYRWQKPESP